MGDQYLRQLLVVGMTSLLRQTRSHPERASKWLRSLFERKPARVATFDPEPNRPLQLGGVHIYPHESFAARRAIGS